MARRSWQLVFATLGIAFLLLVGCRKPQKAAPVAPPPPPVPQVEPPLVAEAGFVEVPPQLTGDPHAARMFYSFRPADQDPQNKPLLVFFNGGGQGIAGAVGTTFFLLSYGTGPSTLLANAPDGGQAPDGGLPVPNPASFTRFANLLYIDARQAGFSYGLREDAGAGDAGDSYSCTFSELDDAADFVRVVIAFLDEHKALRATPVVLVGESYGGTRAVDMLHILYGYRTAVGVPSDLSDAVQAHFEAIVPSLAGTTIAPEQIASQFGHVVFIEALILGGLQEDAQMMLMPMDPYIGTLLQDTMLEPYNLLEPNGWFNALGARSSAAFTEPMASTLLLGVDLPSIAELLPAARAKAFRVPWVVPDAMVQATLAGQLGPLRPGDAYMEEEACGCNYSDNQAADDSDTWFFEVLRYASAFLTHGRYDGEIYTPAIPYVIQNSAMLPTTLDTSPTDTFVARPGWIRFTLPADGALPAKDVAIRFPTYVSSGHLVEASQAADFADDVEEWLGGQ